jgi:hypothetical protein
LGKTRGRSRFPTRRCADHPTVAAANGSAIVALSGGLKGGARLAAPAETVTALASALMGEEVSALDADSEDAFAELADMITGGIQSVGRIVAAAPAVFAPDARPRDPATRLPTGARPTATAAERSGQRIATDYIHPRQRTRGFVKAMTTRR